MSPGLGHHARKQGRAAPFGVAGIAGPALCSRAAKSFNSPLDTFAVWAEGFSAYGMTEKTTHACAANLRRGNRIDAAIECARNRIDVLARDLSQERVALYSAEQDAERLAATLRGVAEAPDDQAAWDSARRAIVLHEARLVNQEIAP